jgi:hypothetical protein
VGVVVVGVVVVVVVAQEVFYVSLDLCMSELRKLGSVCIWPWEMLNIHLPCPVSQQDIPYKNM